MLNIFGLCYSVANITIPSSVTYISNDAFYDCSSLESIVVASGNATYDSRNNCNAIIERSSNTLMIGCKKTVIPSSVTAIGDYAFHSCTGLTSIEIPSSVTAIGDDAFQSCTGLTSIEIPNSVTSIGSYAFQDCTGLTSIEIPNGLTSIGNSAFGGCSKLSGITIPSSVTNIGGSAFDYCTNLASIVVETDNIKYDSRNDCNAIIETESNTLVAGCKSTVIPNNVTSIGGRAFYGCTGLTSVEIPSSVTTIGSSAFSSCTGLTSIEIPSSVTTIGSSAFSNCTSLTSVEIPSSVTSIGDQAFYYCSSLSSIDVKNAEVNIGNSAFEGTPWYNSKPDGLLYIGKVAYKYKGTMPSNTNIVLEDGTIGICGSAFYGCTGLASIEIPNSVTTIGSSAFYGCTGLASIEIPNGVTTIGSSAFSGCTGLTEIEIPSGVTKISNNTFFGCAGLTEIEIPSGVTEIGYCVFQNCTNLASVTIPSSVTSIGWGVFESCNKIKTVTLSVANIGSWFRGRTSITTVNLTDEVTSIGNYAFEGCSSLTSIEIPSSVKSIGYNAFYNCPISTLTIGMKSVSSWFSGKTSLTSVTFTDGVESIESSAFSGCTSLTTLTIPSSVTSFGNNAFSNCPISTLTLGMANISTWFQGKTSLTSVTLEDGVESIGDNAFSGCNSLVSVTIPNGVTSIGNFAFENCTNLASIDIPNSIISVGSNAFYRTLWYNNKPDGLVYIGKVAYKYKGTMPEETSISIEDGTVCIGNSAFSGCKGLTSVTIPSSVTNIGDYAFNGCTGLTSLSNLSCAIGSSAFSSCTNLTSIDLTECPSIGNHAFSGCNNLLHLTLGENIPEAGNTVLEGTYMMVYVPTSKLDDYKSADGWSNYASRFLPIGTQTIYDLDVTALASSSVVHAQIGESNLDNVVELKLTGSINSYDIMIMRDKMPSLRKLDLSNANIVASSYTYMTGYQTSNDTWKQGMCPSSVINLTLPSSLKTIGDYAFENKNNLTKLEIPEGVTTIGIGAFHGCNLITNIPKSVTSIGTGAFHKCLGIVSLDFSGTSISSIGEFAFLACSNLKTIDLSNAKIGTIGSYAFINCDKLESIIAKKATINRICGASFCGSRSASSNSYYWFSTSNSNSYLQHINTSGYYLYPSGFPALVSLDLSESQIGQIDDEAFSKCSSLDVNFTGAKINNIYGYAFYGTAIQKVNFANSPITSIGTSAFQNCSKLEEVDLSNSSINSIGTSAFSSCSKLEQVNLTGCSKLTTISEYALSGTKLAEIRIPSTVTTIGNYAFSGCNSLKDVYSQSILPRTIDVSTFSTTTTKEGVLHVPSLSYYNYYWATNWSQFRHIVEDSNPDYFYVDDDLTVENGRATDDPVNVDIVGNNGVVVNDDEQTFNEVTVTNNGTNSGTLITENNTTINIINLNITVTANKWQFISFPYRVRLADVVAPGFYVFRRYDGAQRASTGGTGWASLLDGTEYLEPGVGYIFQSSKSGTLGIRSENPDLSWGSGKTNPLSVYTTDNIQHASWNFVGNPMLCYYDIDDLHTTAPLTFWNGSSYVARRPGDDNYQMKPFEAFFLQKPNDVEALVYEKSGRMTYKQAQEHHNNKNNNARAAERSERFLINLSLTQGQWEDEARVVYNNKKTTAYEPDCDAAKFMSTMSVPQLYAIEGSVQMAIDERPWGEVQLGFIATAEGEHTITATRLGTNVLLRDNLLNITHDLSLGGYTFTTEAGTFNDRFTLVPEAETTGINALNEKGEMRNEKFFDLQGRRIAEPARGQYIKDGKKFMKK